jgi:hypothetical protein
LPEYKLDSTTGRNDVDIIAAEPFSVGGSIAISVAEFDDLRQWEDGQGKLFVDRSEPTVASLQVYAERYHPTFRGP